MTRIRMRGGAEYEWDAADPVLNARECGVTTDTHRIKVGDGVLPWSSLPWSDEAGQSIIGRVVSVSADYDCDPDDHVVLVTASPVTVTLPTAVGRIGKQAIVKNTADAAITVTGTEPIDASDSQPLQPWESITVMSNDVQWVIL